MKIYLTCGPRPNLADDPILQPGDVVLLLTRQWVAMPERGEDPILIPAIIEPGCKATILSVPHNPSVAVGLLWTAGLNATYMYRSNVLYIERIACHDQPMVMTEDCTESMGITECELTETYSVRYDVRRRLVPLESIIERTRSFSADAAGIHRRTEIARPAD